MYSAGEFGGPWNPRLPDPPSGKQRVPVAVPAGASASALYSLMDFQFSA